MDWASGKQRHESGDHSEGREGVVAGDGGAVGIGVSF